MRKGEYKYPPLNDKAWLYQKYRVEKKGSPKIADIVGCEGSTVLRALRRYNILHTRYPELNDKSWLIQKYCVERQSSLKIAKMVGCSKVAVLYALKKFNISRRTASEALESRELSQEHKRNIGKAQEHISEETRRKRSKALKGKNNPFYGKHHTEKTKQKQREAHKHQTVPKKDTKPELIFIEFYHKFGIENRVKDTRDNSFHIGRLNPDFIIRDKRAAIFINGDYWHDPFRRPNMQETSRADFQIAECKRHKWKPIIIWESDLLREDAEQFVLAKLKKERVID